MRLFSPIIAQTSNQAITQKSISMIIKFHTVSLSFLQLINCAIQKIAKINNTPIPRIEISPKEHKLLANIYSPGICFHTSRGYFRSTTQRQINEYEIYLMITNRANNKASNKLKLLTRLNNFRKELSFLMCKCNVILFGW